MGYQACVLPKLDYASPVWHNPRKDKGHLRVLSAVQRVALLRIISAFRSVATQTLEVECHILPTHLRLKRRRLVIQYCARRCEYVKSLSRRISFFTSDFKTWNMYGQAYNVNSNS